MAFKKVSFEETLLEKVMDGGKCVGCGTCVVVCPFSCLEYEQGRPRLAKECKVCGICAGVCPVYEWSRSEAEESVFGRERKVSEEFGVFRRLTVARATNSDVLKVCQDGGVVTALLLYALENEIIDSAVVSGISHKKPLFPAPMLAISSEEIMDSAGTRYFRSPNILALAEGIKQKKSNVAFVGTPCQIHAIRRMQLSGLKKYTNPIRLLVGLMCSESFEYEGLMVSHIQETLGVEPMEIKKMNIKGKILVTTETGSETISLAKAKEFVVESCRFCDDFSNELADISVGGLGLNGWTFTIIRTERGEELFSDAEKAGAIETRPVKQGEFALNLLVKLSRKKQRSTSG